MECHKCHEKKRADYWHKIATNLFVIIGGIVGGVVGSIIVLFCD